MEHIGGRATAYQTASPDPRESSGPENGSTDAALSTPFKDDLLTCPEPGATLRGTRDTVNTLDPWGGGFTSGLGSKLGSDAAMTITVPDSCLMIGVYLVHAILEHMYLLDIFYRVYPGVAAGPGWHRPVWPGLA